MASVASYHIILCTDGGWQVRKTGSLRALKRFSSQSEAVSWGRVLSAKSQTELVIHKSDGRVQEIEPPKAASALKSSRLVKLTGVSR